MRTFFHFYDLNQIMDFTFVGRYNEFDTVQDTFSKILAFQGHRVEGLKSEAILKVVSELEELRKEL